MARLIDAIQGHALIWSRLEQAVNGDHLPHALAFTGPIGVGKRALAFALAQRLLCQADAKPCGACGACKRVASGQSESVYVLEPQGASPIKLEAAHGVLEFLSLRRLSSARVIIVDDAQKFNPQAANALLKVVEEPPPGTHFIFIVPEISQLLPTLRSRAQVVRFASLSADILAQGEDVPSWMLQSARGSFARLAAFREDEVDETRRLAFAFLSGSLEGRREILERVCAAAKDRETALETIHFLQQALRDWTLINTGDEIHSDLRDDVAAWPSLPSWRKVELWRASQQMEFDVLGNVDRNLVFENFFHQTRNSAERI